MNEHNELPPFNIGRYMGAFIGGGAFAKSISNPEQHLLAPARLTLDQYVGYHLLIALEVAKNRIELLVLDPEVSLELLRGLNEWVVGQTEGIRRILMETSIEVLEDIRDSYISDRKTKNVGADSELAQALVDILFFAGEETDERWNACCELVMRSSVTLGIYLESIRSNVDSILREEGCISQVH